MDPAAASPIDYLLMDSALYEAVVEGNEDDVDESLWYKMEQHGGRQVTPKGNTVLHIAALYGHLHFVQKILEKHSSLLCVPNKENETALHIAAREGHSGVVSTLINCAKARPELESGIGARDMVRMMDGDKDTALHKAVRKGHLEVVKLLVKEDPEFEFGANVSGETPLYLAAELQFHECLVEILNNSHRPVFDGPLGRTALHAAIIHRGSPKDSTKLLLEKEASLCEVGDDWGWTPLHYAVRLHNEKALYEILQVKSSAAYIPAGGKEGMYKAAVKGNTEDWVIVQQKASEFKSNVTPKGNTVLHIAARYGHTHLVHKILEVCDDALLLLCAQNKKNETALHIAAKEGHTHVVSALICYAKKRPELESGIGVRGRLRMSNSDGDTALHMAVRGGHRVVVKQLAKEDDEFEFPGNKMGETPLYLAAMLSFHDCLSDMLNSSRKPAYGGPLGRTALHAAVISKSTDCVKALLAKESGLGEVGDIYGWTPLHYAAKFSDDEGIIVGEIVGVKSSLAYLPAPCKDGGGWTTAFHIAASGGGAGGIKAMEAILKQCPDAWEMVDSKGRNVLHEAVANDRKDVTDYILQNHHHHHPNLDHLIDEKDDDGNTPLHYAAATNNYYERWYGLGFYLHPRAELLFRLGFSKLLATPWEEESMCSVIKNGSRGVVNQQQKKAANAIIGGMTKSAKSEIIVAALIATVTFAAAFTVPGGYDDDGPGSGMAVLRRKAGFWAFVIADTVAFVCAFAALCGYILLLQASALGWWRQIPISMLIYYHYSVLMHNVCGAAVVVAFVSGLYTVLVPSTTLKSVGVCVCICVCIFCIIGYTRFFTFIDRLITWILQRKKIGGEIGVRSEYSLMYEKSNLVVEKETR